SCWEKSAAESSMKFEASIVSSTTFRQNRLRRLNGNDSSRRLEAMRLKPMLGGCLLATLAGCSCPGDVSVRGGNKDAGLVITPQDTVLELTLGAKPSQPFIATGNGLPVTPIWSVSPTSLGSIDPAGLFTASGTAGGTATIAAVSGAAQGSTT